jgi:hypothetical protein
MFTTSADILNLIIAGCIIFLTVFICILLHNLIASLRRINKITKIVETGVIKVEEVVNLAKEKLHSSSAYFMILAELAKKAMEFVKEKRSDGPEKKKKKK